MNYNQDFIKLVESLKLTKIQVIETQTQRLADPEAGIPELKYKIDHFTVKLKYTAVRKKLILHTS